MPIARGDPHPEQCSRPAAGQGRRHSCNIPRTDGRRQRCTGRLKRRNLCTVIRPFFVCVLSQKASRCRTPPTGGFPGSEIPAAARSSIFQRPETLQASTAPRPGYAPAPLFPSYFPPFLHAAASFFLFYARLHMQYEPSPCPFILLLRTFPSLFPRNSFSSVI